MGSTEIVSNGVFEIARFSKNVIKIMKESAAMGKSNTLKKLILILLTVNYSKVSYSVKGLKSQITVLF